MDESSLIVKRSTIMRIVELGPIFWYKKATLETFFEWFRLFSMLTTIAIFGVHRPETVQ